MPVLQINSDSTINEFQRSFSGMFPFLKIEFFKVLKSTTKRKEKLESRNVKVIDISKSKKFGKIIFKSDMTVVQIENFLWNEYGLIIQIFRKSGSIWLETSETGNWSLERQNSEAKSLEEQLKFKD